MSVCVVVSGRGKSIEKQGRREITSGGRGSSLKYLARFSFPCFSKFKKILTIFAPQNAAAFSETAFSEPFPI